jgi:hypothetical protein
MSEIQHGAAVRKGESSADAGPDRVIVWEVKQDLARWVVGHWRFSVVFAGKRRDFCGVPNRCDSAREARARGGWRLKWLREGTFSDHYGPPMPWPGLAPVRS